LAAAISIEDLSALPPTVKNAYQYGERLERAASASEFLETLSEANKEYSNELAIAIKILDKKLIKFDSLRPKPAEWNKLLATARGDVDRIMTLAMPHLTSAKQLVDLVKPTNLSWSQSFDISRAAQAVIPLELRKVLALRPTVEELVAIGEILSEGNPAKKKIERLVSRQQSRSCSKLLLKHLP
jgi:hypothetical protein